jgi:hypothetical protein
MSPGRAKRLRNKGRPTVNIEQANQAVMEINKIMGVIGDVFTVLIDNGAAVYDSKEQDVAMQLNQAADRLIEARRVLMTIR